MPALPLPFLRMLSMAACALAAAAAWGEPIASTLSDVPDAAAMPPEALERAFWVCDHAATVQGVDATPVAACTSVFETLKETKFGGDFLKLLAWWRANKVVEHTKLDNVIPEPAIAGASGNPF